MQRIVFIYFFIALSVTTYAQQLSKQDKLFVDSIMNANYKPNEPGAVLMIAKNGRPIFSKGYGLASVELNVPNTPKHIFNIGSMSKQFTAVCMLKLAQEGRVNLQDDITKYLPSYNTHSRYISIQNLLNHTSGIIDYFTKKEVMLKRKENQSRAELMDFFMNDSLAFEPGTDWGYSNSGYMVAASIIEKVSGLPFSEYLQKNIFNPLEMSHTSVQSYDTIVINAVNGYDPAPNDKFQPTRFTSSSWFFGAGGIITNVDDLLKWDNALYTEKIIKKEWLEKAWKPYILTNGQTTNYGFGWTSNSFNGLQFIEHAGGVNGFSSDGIRIPSKHLYLVMLSNNSQWFVPILSSIALQMTGQNLTKSSPIIIDTKMMNEYTGVYAIKHSLYAINHTSFEQTYQYFTIKDNTLFAQSPGYSKGALLNVTKDIFIGGNQFYHFHRNEKGEIISVELYSEPVQTGPHEIQLKTDIQLPKDRQAISLDIRKLELLKGKYDFGGGIISPVTVEGQKIYMLMPSGEKEEIFAESETQFFSKKTDITIEFIKNKNYVNGMILNVQGTKFESKKID